MTEGLQRLIERIVGTFRFEYSTVRELEHKCFRVFWFVGAMIALGFILMLSNVGAFIGIPLLVLGVLLFVATLVWVLMLQREPRRDAYCPYCGSKNEVFASRKEFLCDVCQGPVGVLPNGNVIPLETPEEREAKQEARERAQRHQM
jgi:hypothetical protein